MNCRFVLVCILLVLVLGTMGEAQLVPKQVTASVSYKPIGLFKNKVPPEAMQQVELKARQIALALYMSDCSPAKRELLEQIKEILYSSLAEVVPQLTVLDNRVNKKYKTLEISATAYVDAGRIGSVIQQQNPTPVVAVSSAAEREEIVLVFVARKINSVVISDGKKVSFNKTSREGSEVSEQGVDANGAYAHSQQTDLNIQEFGGKTIKKADEVVYDVQSVSSVDAAVNEVFTQGRYDCVDAAFIDGFSLEDFRADYATGDDLQPETKRVAIRLLHEYEVGFFVTARMDVGVAETHEVSGLKVVHVKVEAQVYDIRRKLPRNVASVKGVYFMGTGPNEQVATQNALNTAATRTASQLLDQLRARGV